jgi:hypothetical protein
LSDPLDINISLIPTLISVILGYKGLHDKTDQFLTQKNGLFKKKKQIKIEGEKFQKTDQNLNKKSV